MRGRARGGTLLALVAALAVPALAAIPSADKVAGAVASANRAAQRTQVLELAVELQRADGERLASGTLLAHPSDRARLELVGGGVVERHLAIGASYQAARNAEPLPHPRPFLPPLSLLQAASGSTLEAALGRLGATPGAIALGRVGDHDCYVLGGRAPGPDRNDPPLLTALWVDQVSFAPVRIDRSDGVRFRLGPIATFGEVGLPAWIDVEAPNEPVYRLKVVSVSAARAEPSDFRAGWLAEPVAAPGAARAAGSEQD